MFRDEQSQKGVTCHVALLHVICETSIEGRNIHQNHVLNTLNRQYMYM